MMENLFKELRRRNVFRVGLAYLVGAWLITQIVANVSPILGLPPAFGKGVLLVLALGFPAALLFSWIYELTPEGLKKTAEVPEAQSISVKTGRKFDYAILAGLALVAIILIADRFAPGAPSAARTQTTIAETASAAEVAAAPSTAAASSSVTSLAPAIAPKSIAVLPFSNRSPNPDDAFFTEGVHDDLLTHLSKIADMHVISRTSVMRYAGTTEPIPEIARALGVANVMEGAVQRAGNRVRINVQLIDGATDEHIWAEIYDRELTADNIFSIQTEITTAIAAALKSVLSPQDLAAVSARPTKSLAAYDAYLKGMSLTGADFLRGPANFLDAVAHFDAAIAKDPDFAAAYAAKATALLKAYWTNNRVDGAQLAEAQEALARAKALAPDAAETLIADSHYHYRRFLDFERAEKSIDAALMRAPNNAQAWRMKGDIVRRRGRFDDAEQAYDKVISLDPALIVEFADYAAMLALFGRFEKANALAARMEEFDTDGGNTLSAKVALQFSEGDADGACRTIDAAIVRPDWTYVPYMRLVCALSRPPAERPKDVDPLLAAIPEEARTAPGYPEAFNFTRAYAYDRVGRKAEARQIALGIAERLKASGNPYPDGWSSNAPYLPTALPALLGDLAGVRAAAKDFEENARPDALRDLYTLMSIAEAFAFAGDPDAAFDYIGRITRVTGPARYLEISINPAFDEFRSHPRYLALKAEYEKWAVARKR